MAVTLPQFHLDAATYGNPTVQMPQKPGKQFNKGLGDLGRGLYRAYNPTAPFAVTVNWQWSGQTLAAFRLAWENGTSLTGINRGANWITMDLPLFIDHTHEADTALYSYVHKAEFIYSVLIGGNGGVPEAVGFRSDFYGAVPYGDLEAKTLMGLQINEVRLGTGDFMNVRVGGADGSGLPLPGAVNAATLEFEFVDTGEVVTLTWNTDYYNANAINTAPIAVADWRASVGQTRLISVRPVVQRYQRYTVHFVQPFQTTMAGYDRWDVTGNLEVDVTPWVLDA